MNAHSSEQIASSVVGVVAGIVRQAATGVAVAQTFPAFVGAILGIPGGIAIYAVTKSGGGTSALSSVVVGRCGAWNDPRRRSVDQTTPARIDARQSTAESLQSETG